MGTEGEQQNYEANSEAERPASPTPDPRELAPPDEEELASFEDKPPMNMGLLLLWIAASLSVLLTAYFWWSGRNIADNVATEQDKVNQTLEQVNSSTMKETATKAQDFKASVSALAEAKDARFPYAIFLPELYTKVTKESYISALSIADDGKLNLTARAKSYRGAAEFATALSSWDALSGVDLGSISVTTPESGSAYASFSLSAQIKKDAWKEARAASSTGGTE